jgi:hypothetical protein
LSYADTNLPNQTYSYYVKARYGTLESTPTATVTAVITVAYPAANVIATMNGGAGSNGAANITWTAPAGGPTHTGYNVYFLLDGQQNNPGSWIVVAQGITATTITDSFHGGLNSGSFGWAVVATYQSGTAPAAHSNVLIYVGNDDDENQYMTELTGNYPNPFNPKTNITFTLRTATAARLLVYNSRGQIVKTLTDANLPAGKHTVEWNGTDDNGRALGSGVYFYHLLTPEYRKIGKTIMMK